ncbi:hypothetical protein ACFS6H_07355 [Terrimonas rubra]|uniref:Lipoprotein n=1 Tax=Terrimonas rubra TaxID=1035890 RepID=A0ABW6A2G2_9BACT
MKWLSTTNKWKRYFISGILCCITGTVICYYFLKDAYPWQWSGIWFVFGFCWPPVTETLRKWYIKLTGGDIKI